jgi:hypothetical protein
MVNTREHFAKIYGARTAGEAPTLNDAFQLMLRAEDLQSEVVF